MEERKPFVQKRIEDSMPREAIRRELISHGISTEGFEAEYAELLKEAGKTEPAPEKPLAATPITGQTHAEPQAPVALPGVGAMLGFGLDVTKRKGKEIVVLAVVSLVPMLVFLLLPDLGMLFNILLLSASIFVSFLATTAMLYIVIRHDEQVRSTDALQWAFRHFFSLVWISLLSTLVTITGFAFLLIPAFIFGIYNVFSVIAFVREDARGTRALVRSTDLVRGAFWGILGRLLLITLIFFGVGIVIGFITSIFENLPVFAEVTYAVTMLLQMVLTAVSFGACVLLYESRRQTKPLFDLSAYTALTWVYRIGALVGVILIGGVIIVALASINTYITEKMGGLQGEFGGSAEIQDGINFNDFLLQQKVAATAASAGLYVGKMGSYEGVCGDITVVEPIQCLETAETFAVFAALSNGQYYCSDSASFSGQVDSPLRDTALCQ